MSTLTNIIHLPQKTIPEELQQARPKQPSEKEAFPIPSLLHSKLLNCSNTQSQSNIIFLKSQYLILTSLDHSGREPSSTSSSTFLYMPWYRRATRPILSSTFGFVMKHYTTRLQPMHTYRKQDQMTLLRKLPNSFLSLLFVIHLYCFVSFL